MMETGMLPGIVIVVSGTHWQCVTCKLLNERSVSLDQHLQQTHPCYPPPPPPLPAPTPPQQILSDGEEYEEVEQVGVTEGGQVSQVSQWLKYPDFGDSSDDGFEVDNDDDDDSDFVPSDLEGRSKAKASVSRRTVRKQPKKEIIKREKLQLPKKAETAVEQARDQILATDTDPEFEPPTEQEQTEPEDDGDELYPKAKSRRGCPSTGLLKGFTPKAKQGKKTVSSRKSVPTATRNQTPKKRGRPPKPKPSPAESEKLKPKFRRRKRIPDPSELLLMLHHIGRTRITRRAVPTAERGRIKDTYIKFVSKGNPVGSVSEQCEKVQVEDNNSSMAGDHQQDQNGSGLNTNQDGTTSVDAVSASIIQQLDKSSGEKVRCQTCLFPFNSEKLLTDHLSSISEEDVVQCTACEMKFHGLMDLNMHVFCVHEYKKYPLCFLCKEDFKSMEKLERHLNHTHKGKPACKLSETRFHECRLCSVELNIDLQLIKGHYYIQHKAYVCPKCFGKDVDLLFYTDTHLYAEHKQIHAKSPWECPICCMLFPTNREMRKHMWTHADDSTEDGTGGKCIKCDKWLPNSGALLMHEQEHINSAKRKRNRLEGSIGFPCVKCKDIFRSTSALNKHSCKADPNRIFHFHCEYCGHGCNTKMGLQDHIALHHLGVKRHACSYCEERFTSALTLRKHVRRVHTKEKPYECHICKERFYERYVMMRHISKHTGIFSFMCEICNKGFPTKSALKYHVENHMNTREFVCPKCGLDYKRKHHLKRHLEKGCKKKKPGPKKKRFPARSEDENPPSVASEVPLAAREDADEMVYMDLAAEGEITLDSEGENDDTDLDNYSEERNSEDENIPSVLSEVPLAAREDADEMVYMDLAEDEITLHSNEEHDDANLDNYNDERTGPDYVVVQSSS